MILGEVIKGGGKIEWLGDTWASETHPLDAAFLNEAGIGTGGINDVLLDAYDNVVKEACELVGGDSWKCFVGKASVPGRVY